MILGGGGGGGGREAGQARASTDQVQQILALQN